jgi:hypothetical protein
VVIIALLLSVNVAASAIGTSKMKQTVESQRRREVQKFIGRTILGNRHIDNSFPFFSAPKAPWQAMRDSSLPYSLLRFRANFLAQAKK